MHNYALVCSILLRQLGVPHAAAKFDPATGKCLTCGEIESRCPGVHTFEQIQDAARRQKEVKK